MKHLLINYLVKPEKVEENISLIKSVFEELKVSGIEGVKYAAFRMGDNLFVHVARFETNEAHERFTSLQSFRDFRKDIVSRQIEKPVTNHVEEIGSFSTLG